VKQVGPMSGIMSSFVAALTVGEGGQHAGEVGPVVIVAEVTPMPLPLF